MVKKNSIIILTGPTAVGKTKLSIDIAKHLNAEILNCDSRQIFKEMTIGTAVPEPEELSAVQHHFIQTHSIHNPFNVYEYEQQAIAKLEQLFKTNSAVVVTGGSMMYIDALCKGIDFQPDVPPLLREELKSKFEANGIEWLRGELKNIDPIYFEEVDQNNPKRMLHGLEVSIVAEKPYSSFRTNSIKERSFNIVKICLDRDRIELYDRINKRVEIMFRKGLEKEAKELLKYKDLPALNTVGYKETFKYLEGEYSLDFAIERIQANTRKYARKQLTWFRRDGQYQWFHPEEEKVVFNYIDAKI